MSNSFNRKQSQRKRELQSRKAKQKQGGSNANKSTAEAEEATPKCPEAASAAMELDAKRDSAPKIQAQEIEPQAPKDYAVREFEPIGEIKTEKKPLLSVKGFTIGAVGMILLMSGYFTGKSIGLW